MNLLEVENLVCSYNTEPIIKGISFSLQKGGFLGIIGPNGAGKTTLFKALTKILQPVSGSIFYQERNLTNLSTRELACQVAVLPQSLEITFSFSVEEFIFMGRFPHLRRLQPYQKYDRAIVERAMEQVDVTSFRKRKINKLSGGERQRVLFAQALAQEPKLLLLDEPVSHLDIKHQVEIMDLLRDLNQNKITIAIILHDLNLASEYCDDLILLNEGKIHMRGSPVEVLDYKIIEEVYKTIVVTEKNPLSGKPYILLVSKAARKSL